MHRFLLTFFIPAFALSCQGGGAKSKEASSPSSCDTIQSIKGLGFYFNNIAERSLKNLAIKINSERWETVNQNMKITDSIRKQRYFFFNRKIETNDTIFVRFSESQQIHKIYGFKYLKMPINLGGNRIQEECRFYELKLDGQLQNGGVVLFQDNGAK